MHKGSPPPPRIGEKLVYLEETPSTNAFLWNLVERGAADGQAVQAAFQYKGKGQAGASWESEAGANLLLSFYLKTHFLPATEQFKLNMAIALGVSDFGRLYLGPQVLLKWPNDLFYKHKKWGGILIENTIQGNFLCDSVVGIGINVNQSYFPNRLPQAASFFTITGHYYKLDDLRQELFDRVQRRIDGLMAGDFSQQRQEYRQRLLGIEESRMFEFQGQLLRATIVDVDDEGRLVLESPMGRMRMNNKEIKFRFDG